MKIVLKPIGDIHKEILIHLEEQLGQTFGCPVETVSEDYNLKKAYDGGRKQYRGTKILDRLKKRGAAKDEKVLAVVDVDLYAPGLSFIFGQADTAACTSVISLSRLKQEYDGLPCDEALFLERAVKEAVHELGHTFGLEHCPNSKCVMHFSNSLADTDWKQANFCGQCRPKLIK